MPIIGDFKEYVTSINASDFIKPFEQVLKKQQEDQDIKSGKLIVLNSDQYRVEEENEAQIQNS